MELVKIDKHYINLDRLTRVEDNGGAIVFHFDANDYLSIPSTALEATRRWLGENSKDVGKPAPSRRTGSRSGGTEG